MLRSFLAAGLLVPVMATESESNCCATKFPAGEIFSNAHEDNDNPYDAPVPGFVGPDGEGISNPEAGKPPPAVWQPPKVAGEANYVNPLFLGWADKDEDYNPANNVESPWWYSTQALGPVTGQVANVVSLGDLSRADMDGLNPTRRSVPGELLVSFSRPIYDAPGADIVVFENGFLSEHTTEDGSINGEMFAELAYVEVSSDGDNFVRFPAISRTPHAVGKQGTVRPRNIYNLVGKHSNAYGKSWGTPFDLAELRGLPETAPGGLVDLDNIRYVKIIDIPGSGDFKDCAEHPIYDAWETYGSGGADIEAIGAISQPHTYGIWQQQQNTPKPADDPQTFQLIGGAEEDFDGDGLPNLLEYLLALDPRAAEPSAQLQFDFDVQAGEIILGFRRDVRVSDYKLVLERSLGGALPLQWEPVLTLGPMNAEAASPAVRSVQSESLLPQRSLGVIRRYEVVIFAEPQAGAEFFRLRAEPVAP